MPPEEYLTTRQVADLLKLCEVTVRRWCHEGRLPAVKLGRAYRIRRVDFDRLFEGVLPPSAVESSSDQTLA